MIELNVIDKYVKFTHQGKEQQLELSEDENIDYQLVIIMYANDIQVSISSFSQQFKQ